VRIVVIIPYKKLVSVKYFQIQFITMKQKMEIRKKLDKQGRLVLPREWREKFLEGDEVILRFKGESIEIIPSKKPDLTKYFDSVEVDVESDLSDWKALRKELHEIR